MIDREKTLQHIINRLYECAINNDGYICDAGDVYISIAEDRIKTWLNEIPEERKDEEKVL